MGEHLVTGIASNSDPQQLAQTLIERCGIDAGRVSIYTKRGATAAGGDEVHNARLGNNAAIMSGSGGTGVPGIGGGNASLSSLMTGSHVRNYIGSLSIPRDVAEHYNVAIDEGRAVVAYKASAEEAAQTAEAFRACGLRNVKSF